MNLALFDLDHTLLSGDSDFEWSQFLINKGVLDRATYEAKTCNFYADYRAGTLNIAAFLEFQLAPLARRPRATLDAWHREFMSERIKPLMGEPARELVQSHIAAGDLCAVVTATNNFITGPVCRAFGIDHLIATVAACQNGEFTGQPRGQPAFRKGKIARVEEWLEFTGLWWGFFERSYFYSDSHNDLPLLEHVSNPVAVNPDDILHTQAKKRGWRILSLRQ